MRNLRYKGEFQDIYGQECLVEIFQEGYDGSPEELLLAENPVIIRYEQDDDVFKPIIYSGLTLTVLTDKILDIYSPKALTNEVVLTRCGEYYWRGYITPNTYSSEYWSEADTLEIECIDILSAYKYVDYTRDEEDVYNDVYFVDILKKYLKIGDNYDFLYADDLNDDIEILNKLRVNERTFFNEEEEPMKVNEVLESISRYLGCTLTQVGGYSFYLYNPILVASVGRYKLEDYYNYICYSPDDPYGSKSVEGNNPELLEIAENTSQIERGNVYNQIKVNASLQNIEEDTNLINLDDCNEVGNETFYNFTDKKEFYVQAFNNSKLNIYPNNLPINGNTYAANILRSCSVDIEQKEDGYYHVIPYQHPSWDVYYSHNVNSNPIFNNTTDNISKANLITYNDCIFKYTSDYTIKTSKLRDLYITISGSVLYDSIDYFSDKKGGQRYFNFKKTDAGQIMLYGQLKIGGYYFDGEKFTTSPKFFPIGCDNSTDEAYRGEWYQIKDTTPFNPVLNGNGFCIKIDTHNPANIVFGRIELSLYSVITRQFKGDGIYEDDGGVKHLCEVIFPYNYEDTTPPELWIIKGSEQERLVDSDKIEYTWDWTANIKYYPINDFYKDPADYVLLKDINIKIESSKVDFFKVEEDSDTSYSKVIDEDNVEEFGDISLVLNTYNPDFNQPLSFSYVFTDEDDYVDTLYQDGYDIKPEMHIVRRYCDYYGSPKLIHTNTYKLSEWWMPEFNNGYRIPYLKGKRFMIGNREINVKYATINIKGYEI